MVAVPLRLAARPPQRLPLSSSGTIEPMGKGRELGDQLQTWLERGDRQPLQGRLLEGVLLDALGSDEPRLRGPLRDLALQPLLLTLLQECSPAARRSMLDTLCQDLRSTYAAPVLVELLDLLEAATGLPTSRQPVAAAGNGVVTGVPPRSVPPLPQRLPSLLLWLASRLKPLAPGLALAFATALVVGWLGGEIERLRPSDSSSALLLVLLLAILQLLMLLRPLSGLRLLAPLRLQDSADPRLVWRWITAPWLHHRHGEALLNGSVLLILLLDTPLPLGSLLLRYLLSTLATMIPAVLLARRWRIETLWDGASGAVAALIGLAVGVSLLRWQIVSFPFTALSVPVWVLFLVYGAIQMAWVLPGSADGQGAQPWQRLMSSSWFWGTLLGLLWAVLSRLLAWAAPLLQHGGVPS